MPYAPGQQYDFTPLFAGIAQAGKNVNAFIQQKKTESQEANTLRKLMGIYQPEQKDSFTAMGLKDLRASAQAIAAKRQMENDQRAQQESAARLNNLQADNTRADAFLKLNQDQFNQTQQRQTKEEAAAERLRAAATGFARDLGSGPPLVLRPETLDQFSGPAGRMDWALQRNPEAVLSPSFKSLVDLMNERMQNQNPEQGFTEDPVTGARFAKFGRQFLPSGTNPGKMSTETVPLHDADGNPVPGVHLVRMPKGGFQVVKLPEPKVTVDPSIGGTKFTGTPEQLAKWKAEQERNAPPAPPAETSLIGGLLQKLGVGGSKPAAAPTTPAASTNGAPAKPAAKYRAGEVRKQGGRLYQFDGSQWNDIGEAN